jgi:excisionase family DNA binding protein
MVQGYYTLDEAAHILGMEADKLSQMAQRREIRAFADRGTWRFRTQDVEEMARRQGMGSSPDMPLGEARPQRPKGEKADADEGTVEVPLLAEGDAGKSDQDIIIESPSSAKLAGGSPTSKPVTPKPGSDSDVHLVFDVTGDVPVIHDSDINLEDSAPPSKPGSSRKTGSSPGTRQDSGVRLVPLDDDSGSPPIVYQPTPSDSDIRLEPSESHRATQPPNPVSHSPSDSALTTEEINLDEVLKKEEEASRTKKSKVKPKTNVPAAGQAAGAPFQLEGAPESPRTPQGPKSPPPGARKQPVEELRLEPLEEEEVSLGDLEVPSDLTDASSGINLHSPADSGINLGKPGGSDDSLEFELSLEKEATPKPSPGTEEKEDSSGEFELTLDESSGLAPLEEEATQASGEGEKDIFETDFDMPALEEESASEAVALEDADTDLESSDFDLSLGEEESGSQVVALEEEEADEGAATVARRPGRRDAALEEIDEAGDIDELLEEDVGELEEDEADRDALARQAPAVAAAPASWGILPAVVMSFCVPIMFLLCFMSFELLHTMWGYKQPYKPTATIVKWLSDLVGEKTPD